jgi:two-component system nitrate/nitrite response regulator NarL
LKVVARCTDGAAAANAVCDLRPDVAVLDVSMPGVSGIDVLSTIAAKRPTTKVLLLTALATDAQILTAIALGARGIMLKSGMLDELVHCVREIAAGRCWFPPEIVDRVRERTAGAGLEAEHRDHGLTSRERQVIRLVSEGLSNKEVGRRLNLSEGTVKIHLHNIYDKVGVANRTALAAVAIGYLDQLRS